jgi:tetratricopeptide (TPR) repeat protein
MHDDMQKPVNRRPIMAAALVAAAALTALVYWPAVHADWFVMDDYVFFFGNSDLYDTHGLRAIWLDPWNQPHYYPILLTFIWVIAAIFGVEPMPYHIAGIILHFLNAILLWRILATLRLRHAALIGLVFLFHPLCVSSVAWNTELKNTLSGLWALGAMLVWTRMFSAGHDGRHFLARPAWWLTLLLLVLAILSKSTSATILLLMAAAAFWLPSEHRRRALLSLMPLFAVSLAFGVFSLRLEQSFNNPEKVRDITLVESFMIAGQSVYFYASKVLWPSGLNFIYPAWQFGRWSGWLWPLSLPLVGTLLWMLRGALTRAPAVLFALFVVLVFPIPFMSIGFLHAHGFVTDHFVYIAMLPVIVGTVIAIDRLVHQAEWPVHATSCALWAAIGALAVLTARQVELFVGGGIWERSVARMNQVTSAHLFYAQELEKQNRLEEARVIAEGVLAQKPDSVGALNVLANLELRSGDEEAGIALLEKAVERSSKSRGNDVFTTKVADALASIGRTAKAEKYYRQALAENPRQLAAKRGLASLLAHDNRHTEAADVLRNYTNLEASDEEAWTRLVDAEMLRGNPAGALESAAQGRSALPDSDRLKLREAMILAETGRENEARTILGTIVYDSLRSEDLMRCAILQQKLGQDQSAAELAKRALGSGDASPALLDAAAWFFATNRDASVRDGTRALQLSEQAREASGKESYQMLGTAAAAFAAQGKYREAVAMADQAIEVAEKAGDKAFADATRQRRAIYSREMPYIDDPRREDDH